MRRRPFLMLLLLLALPVSAAAQASLLQSGPMAGYSEMREVLLWAQTTRPARVHFVYWDTTAPGRRMSSDTVQTRGETAHTARVRIGALEPGRGYAYELHINGQRVARPYPLRFQTQALWQWRSDPPAFRIALGSCFYVNEPVYDRPGAPYGGDYGILTHLAARRPDVMLWLGDNTYLREVDWYSRHGILARHTHTRSLAELQPLLGAAHHYATWDDHDFGPNDADRSFRDKHLTREAHAIFWGNPTVGVPAVPEGITTMFQWGDAEFFLLDNRWFRTPNYRRTGERTMLGRAQLQWLIDALVFSQAPFKFVVVGGQVLNPVGLPQENLATYPEERAELLRLLAEERIPGVVFLTGDRHHTELSVLPREGLYPLYDLTISPLTAGVGTRGATEGNTLRVEGTYLAERNFATLDFSGPRADRVMTVTVVDKDGQERWTRRIRASELRVPAAPAAN
jgi:alkaline phosphatase D